MVAGWPMVFDHICECYNFRGGFKIRHNLVCDQIGMAGEGGEEDDDMGFEEWLVISKG